MTRFFDCLPVILNYEGGYVDHPNDHGGATNQGITQRVYTGWRTDRGLVDQSVSRIASNEVTAIYQANYWNPCGAGLCPAPLDLVVFDCAVNSGVGRAVRMLQRVLDIDADGLIGPVTKNTIMSCNPKATAKALIEARRTFYRGIVSAHPEQSKFLAGWLNRMAALETEVANA